MSSDSQDSYGNGGQNSSFFPAYNINLNEFKLTGGPDLMARASDDQLTTGMNHTAGIDWTDTRLSPASTLMLDFGLMNQGPRYDSTLLKNETVAPEDGYIDFDREVDDGLGYCGPLYAPSALLDMNASDMNVHMQVGCRKSFHRFPRCPRLTPRDEPDDRDTESATDDNQPVAPQDIELELNERNILVGKRKSTKSTCAVDGRTKSRYLRGSNTAPQAKQRPWRVHHILLNSLFSRTEFRTNYGDPWGMFADTAIPRPLVTEASVIPRNVFGIPVFPGIDLNIVTPADTRVLIEEYWAHVWASGCEFEVHTKVVKKRHAAWAQALYYDTVKFSLPLALALPQTLNTLHTTIWAEHLVRTSSSFADTPFVFYPKERLMGVNGPLATPALVQVNSDAITTVTVVNPLALQPGNQIVQMEDNALRLQNIVDNPPNPLSMNNEKEDTDTRAKRRVEPDDSEKSSRKLAKRNNKNNHHNGNEGTSSKMDASSNAPRRSSRKAPAKVSAPVSRKTARRRHRHFVLSHECRGYVCSDEEGDAFDNDA
ncbi:hypothetical protein DFH08DRAFT_818442 [Mycena albidolilacea]|uniref:Uncharacterized protein n=1 Tax=Mycena albidolilacea TaxID=1033008 RepID=A0AAD6ZG96_9AGAR|nr:hypothetical protein DFH08DRAFT_818442 [Mycena albidolilacea]